MTILYHSKYLITRGSKVWLSCSNNPWFKVLIMWSSRVKLWTCHNGFFILSHDYLVVHWILSIGGDEERPLNHWIGLYFTWALHCYALPVYQKIKIKIKFHSNKNIEWHCMKLELNSTEFMSVWIKFKSIEFQSKRNAMQIDAEIENLLVISIICDHGVGRKSS